MAERQVRITLRDKQTTGGSIPGSALFGEPFVNLYDGILKFSGVTGGSFETSSQTGVFEVGSALYNQKITNRLNINDNFIISGDTGLISTYAGASGAGLSGKFLSGTTTGLVLADIADIAASIDSYTTGATWSPNTLTIDLNNGKPSVNVIIDSFSNLSATTFYSGSTDIDTLFVKDVVDGSNISVGGSAQYPIINVVDSPSFNNINFSGVATGGDVTATSVSATTFYSAGTNLSTVINSAITAVTSNLTSTRVQPGVNTYTGGTPDNPTVNVVDSPSFNSINYSGTSTGGNSVAVNVSATTGFFSAGTSLETIIYNIANSTENITNVQPGSNITTGGTAANPIVSLVDSPSVNNLSFSGVATGGNLFATQLSGGTLYSGSTNLYDIFVDSVNAGSNITIGGTASNPIVNVADSPIFTGLVSATGFTDSSLTQGRVVYVGTGGRLVDEAGFEYDDSTDTLSAGHAMFGIPGQTGTTLTVHGDFLIIGDAISGFTSQLYIEDNLIELNYNPTADTSSTSLGAGWSIQDGSGVAGTDVFFDIRGTGTTVSNRGFATNLNDIFIRESGTVSSPNGVRVLAEYDTLDGGNF